MLQEVVRVEGLGKAYRLGTGSVGYVTLREALTRGPRRWWTRVTERGVRRGSHPGEFWALRDVTLSIREGDVVGIVGRNGAGKSTLLKLLAGITEPTEGRAEIHGRIGSLLEVGMGFHPELTGGENIYLNGAILGMPRRTIQRRFDEIVAFAEVERFIDTQVKQYSSGMHMRLAFSVAAHLETEVLLVDEVLAVGDLAFQEKCLGKMGDLSRSGRTVLFVSHSLAAVSNLCQRAVWLDGGRLKAEGPVGEIISEYVSSVHELTERRLVDRTDRSGDGSVRFEEVRFRRADGACVRGVTVGEDLIVELHYRSWDENELEPVAASVVFTNHLGVAVFNCFTDLVHADLRHLPPVGRLVCRVPRLPLAPGDYSLTLALIVGGRTADKVRDAAILRVVPGDYFGTGRLPRAGNACVMVEHSWQAVAESP